METNTHEQPIDKDPTHGVRLPMQFPLFADLEAVPPTSRRGRNGQGGRRRHAGFR